MQKTYRKLSAAAILKTANIAPDMTGFFHVWVTIPGWPEAQAIVVSVRNGWGEYVASAIGISTATDHVTLSASRRSIDKLRAMVQDANAKTLAAFPQY